MVPGFLTRWGFARHTDFKLVANGCHATVAAPLHSHLHTLFFLPCYVPIAVEYRISLKDYLYLYRQLLHRTVVRK